MSVLEKLKSFRYAVGGDTAAPRELPWKALRSIDVAALRTEEPDLHLMSNLVAIVANFAISPSMVGAVTDTDIAQLLQLMQAAVQFLLHSQSILKGQIVERQNADAVQRVSAKYIERADAKLAAAAEDNKALSADRDTLRLSIEQLKTTLARQDATVKTLERQLAQERERFYTATERQEKLLRLSQPAYAATPPPPAPSSTVECVAFGGAVEAREGRGHRKERRRAQSTSSTTSSASSPSRPASAASTGDERLKALYQRVRKGHNRARACAERKGCEGRRHRDGSRHSRCAAARVHRGPSSSAGSTSSSSASTSPADSTREERLRTLLSNAVEKARHDLHADMTTVQQIMLEKTRSIADELSQLRAGQQRLEVRLNGCDERAATNTPPLAPLSGSTSRRVHRVDSKLSLSRPSHRRLSAQSSLANSNTDSKQSERAAPSSCADSSIPVDPPDAVPHTAVQDPAPSSAVAGSSVGARVPSDVSLPEHNPPQPTEASAAPQLPLPGVSENPQGASADAKSSSAARPTATTAELSPNTVAPAKRVPSLKSSSLHLTSHPSLPDFDLSQLRTPPKGTEDSADAGSQQNLARSTPHRSVPSASRSWYDTAEEERPASAAARAGAGAANASAARSLTSLANTADEASAHISNNSSSSSDTRSGQIGRCEHCRQQLPLAELQAHEQSCDLRVLHCPSCGKRVVARLMSKHKCGPSSVDGDSSLASSVNGSLASSSSGAIGLRRVSSLLLLETQRELQMLMEEQSAYQKSRTAREGGDEPA